ncbi:MAG TPA: MFS transporter, partial [Gaiellaceae bacterium]|nr:MFS transporter [Gaiellaceae bacterium]
AAGLERSVLPLVGAEDFGVQSRTAILAFVASFGAAKALANLASGVLAERTARRRVLVLGWLLVLPVAPLLALAPAWEVVVAANVLLGAGQGLAWSMAIVMKIDLVGPARRGLALGLNESAGYVGVAAAAFVTGAAASAVAPRTAVWVGMAVVALAGLLLAAGPIRDTTAHVRHEQAAHGSGGEARTSLRHALGASVRVPALRACAQAGLVNNLNDAVVWGLVPLYLAARGASAAEVGLAAGLYPAVWGLAQVGTGWLSDSTGRKPLVVAGMLVQGAALGLLAAGGGELVSALAASVLLGLGTALAYPTLIAAVSDVVAPRERAPAVGAYRFWRDAGLVVGALALGLVADAAGARAALTATGLLTALSGLWVARVAFVSRAARE